MRAARFLLALLFVLVSGITHAQAARYTVLIPVLGPNDPSSVRIPRLVVQAGPVDVTLWDGYLGRIPWGVWERGCSGYGSCDYFSPGVRVTFSRPVQNIRARIEAFPYGVVVNGIALNTFRNWPVPDDYTNFQYAPPTTQIDAWITSPITSWGWVAQISNISFELADDTGNLTLELSASSPDEHRRVLTHKYRDDDSYFSPWQTADSEIEIVGYVRGANGQPLEGKTVYFRVRDPADEAVYVRAALRGRDGDNYDTSAGRLTAATSTSDAAGRVSTTLKTTSFAAGDNYVVEASLDPALTGGAPVACAAT